MELIDKSVIVAVIKKKLDKYSKLHSFNYGAVKDLESLLDFLDTLEVKEVDCEREINDYISNNFFGSQTLGFFTNRTKEEPNDQDIALCAKHFYELGLKSKEK